MTARRFFTYIWRFNALALAGVAVLGLLIGSYGLLSLIGEQTRAVTRSKIVRTDIEKQGKTVLTIGGFTWLEQGKIIWAQIRGSQTYRYRLGGKRASATRNYIFYDVRTGKTKHVFAANNAVIINTQVVREGKDHDRASPVRALVLTYVSKDTNADGYITARDRPEVALIRSDAGGFKIIDTAGSRVMSVQLADAETLLLIVKHKQGAQAVYVAVNDFSVKRREIIKANLAAPAKK